MNKEQIVELARKNKSATAVAAIFAVVLLFAIASAFVPVDRSQLIGQWETKNIMIEFKENGKWAAVWGQYGEGTTGTYEWVEDDVLHMEFNSADGRPVKPKNVEIDLSDNELEIDDVFKKGKSTTFTRVQK